MQSTYRSALALQRSLRPAFIIFFLGSLFFFFLHYDISRLFFFLFLGIQSFHSSKCSIGQFSFIFIVARWVVLVCRYKSFFTIGEFICSFSELLLLLSCSFHFRMFRIDFSNLPSLPLRFSLIVLMSLSFAPKSWRISQSKSSIHDCCLIFLKIWQVHISSEFCLCWVKVVPFS